MNKLLKGKKVIVFVFGLLFALSANAKLMIIDFDTPSVTNVFNYKSDPFDSSPFGFSGMSYDDVVSNIMGEVVEDYLGNSSLYPSIPLGWELDIDFQVGNVGTIPLGVTDYFYFRVGEIGSNLPSTGSFGHAGYNFAFSSFFSGKVIGSVFTDNIAAFAGLASNDEQLINLIAGTLSHEIGHTLGLDHPAGREDNPGNSSFGLMGTGSSPTGMPNRERVKDRAFSYLNFDILIDNLGIRRQIPEPPMIVLMIIALFGFGASKRLVKTN